MLLQPGKWLAVSSSGCESLPFHAGQETPFHSGHEPLFEVADDRWSRVVAGRCSFSSSSNFLSLSLANEGKKVHEFTVKFQL